MLPQPNATLARSVLLAVVIFSIIWWIKVTSPLSKTPNEPTYTSPASTGTPPVDIDPLPHDPGRNHPIDALIQQANLRFENLLSKRTETLKDAAAAYRRRRGRHPPPRFQKWFEFAQQRDAIIVEDFFDQIYHDLNPFWGRPAAEVRTEAHGLDQVIAVRNGNATTTSTAMRAPTWAEMIDTISQYLPDMDVACNTMDETRLNVKWEDINQYITKELASRQLLPADQIRETFKGFENIENEAGGQLEVEWESAYDPPYFDRLRKTCPPESLARNSTVIDKWDKAPDLFIQNAIPHLYQGYVSNTTLATSICHQPDIQAQNGIFIEPVSLKTSSRLLPLFAECKLAMNNEILIPSVTYWNKNDAYTPKEFGNAWKDKHPIAIWRGRNAGGRNKEDNWRAYQRPRFVSMTNGTQVTRAENWDEVPPNFQLPPVEYNITAMHKGHLGDWLKTLTDIGLTTLECFPQTEDNTCSYSGPFFTPAKQVSMDDQFECKYLPDIDGNSFSGRYLSFLESTSLPIKATLFQEWHDSRLVAWKHFVPMDSRFLDFYGIMEYFEGYTWEGKTIVPGHDREAETIATAGQQWANKVLRKEDMQVYVMRLLLEYARILDDDRDHLGWVEDLK
ncbi:MAG: hypothetical protein M1824_004653 [Vezdaea acicularis]|nr:MAG: hypothetical protein M1824_004653 [Vezdaea acicularis]